MLPRPWLLLTLAVLPALTTGCGLLCQQRTGGLEGWTRDTPEQAFEYFREAARLERYDLEYDTFAPELIETYGPFTKVDYMRGRPLIHGKKKRLLEALLTAEIEGAPDIRPDGTASMTLVSGEFRSTVLLVKRPYTRIGIDGFPEPVEVPESNVRRRMGVQGNRILLEIELLDPGPYGGMPAREEITRIEVADTWYLLDIGDVIEIQKPGADGTSSDVKKGKP
jgi:hypothetical protein